MVFKASDGWKMSENKKRINFLPMFFIGVIRGLFAVLLFLWQSAGAGSQTGRRRELKGGDGEMDDIPGTGD